MINGTSSIQQQVNDLQMTLGSGAVQWRVAKLSTIQTMWNHQVHETQAQPPITAPQ